MSPLSRRRVNGLEREVHPLAGRDINLSAGPALSRETEIELLSRVLDEAVLMPDMRAAFEDRLASLMAVGGQRKLERRR